MLVIAVSGMFASLNVFRQVLRAIPRGVQKRNGPQIALEARGSSMSGLRPAIAKGEWLGCSIHYSLQRYIHWQCQKSSPFGLALLQTGGMPAGNRIK
jgi:hypothetical protein